MVNNSGSETDVSSKTKCLKCNSDRVVLSRHQGLDGVATAIFPCNTYRCLDCYHRFWGYEGLFANALRLWVWGIGLVVLLVVVLLSMQIDSSQSKFSRKAEFIPQFDSELVSGESDAKLNNEGRDVSAAAALSDTNVKSDIIFDPLLDLAEASTSKAVLNDVKAQAEQISAAQEQSKQRLEIAVTEDEQALGSLLKIDINYRIDGWRKAWQLGNAQSYLQFYSQEFKPNGGLSYAAWLAQRKSRVTSSKKIELELSDFDVSFSDGNRRAVAIFTQHYSSPTYSEKSRKTLVLINEQDAWNIISEASVNQ